MKGLMFDGGGVRGRLTIELLAAVMPDAEEPYLLGGTSTGAIIACAMAQGFEPRRIAKLYDGLAARSFPPGESGKVARLLMTGHMYDGQGLRDALRQVFGDTRLGETRNGRSTMLVAYNLTQDRPEVLGSLTTPNLSVVDAILASTAAPTYLPPHLIGDDVFWDGGVRHNNPTALVLDEYADWAIRGSQLAERDYDAVVSFGTGRLLRAPERPEDLLSLRGISRFRRLLEAAMNTSDSVDLASSLCRNIVRLAPGIPPELSAMDDGSPENLQALAIYGRNWCAAEDGAPLIQAARAALET